MTQKLNNLAGRDLNLPSGDMYRFLSNDAHLEMIKIFIATFYKEVDSSA
jgi:hypothetical protein